MQFMLKNKKLITNKELIHVHARVTLQKTYDKQFRI